MKIAMFSPYGLGEAESGFLYLLGAHAVSRGMTVVQLQCNGALPLCERDVAVGFQRSVQSCLTCIQEQKRFARWATIDTTELSRYIPQEQVEATARIVKGSPIDRVMALSLGGIPLGTIVGPFFRHRFGTALDPNNKGHDHFFRLLALAALRADVGVLNFFSSWEPNLVMVPGAASFLHQITVARGVEPGREVAMFSVNTKKRCTEIHLGSQDVSIECPLTIEDLSSLRRDTKSWTTELVALLDQVLYSIVPNKEVPEPLLTAL